MPQPDSVLAQHCAVTRRFLLRASAAGAAVAVLGPSLAHADRPPQWQAALDDLETYLTTPEDFRDVSRGKPIPHTLPDEKKREVGMDRETWRLEVIGDEEHPPKLRSPLSLADNTALDFAGLMELAKDRAVRFPKVMTCLNIGCPLGMGIWEGVPLRDVVWRTQPREDLRRVFYYGYHNDKPEQMFRSSLPIDRVLEDPDGLPPVILCYKLNGQWLTGARGGPVRVVVPEGYGFKSIKWLTRVVLTNLYHANDTYAGGNNDVASRLKTFAATISVPTAKAGQPIAITGYAQSGTSGLAKVQVWAHSDDEPELEGGPNFPQAPWQDAEILPAPADGQWGGGLPGNKLPLPIQQFDSETGRPTQWPMRLSKAHWAVLLPGLPAGEYTLRCRTIDAHGNAQPMPRPFRKSGRVAIEKKRLVVKA